MAVPGPSQLAFTKSQPQSGQQTPSANTLLAPPTAYTGASGLSDLLKSYKANPQGGKGS